jgi:hypothetical protein
MKSTLKEFMPAQVRAALGSLPTYHSNCLDASGRDKEGRGGVARPGKTARDKAPKGGVR